MSLAGRHNSFCCDFAYNRHNDLQMGLPAEGGWKEKRLLCVLSSMLIKLVYLTLW